jgi:hypothetical protein
MQIYLNIFKKTKLINYKNKLFQNKLNILFLNILKYWINLIFSTFFAKKISKLLLIFLIKYNLVKKIKNFTNLIQFNLLLQKFNIIIPCFYKVTLKGGLTKKIIYPVLKSPFIYKKAFRHFALVQNHSQFIFSGNSNYLKPLLFTNTFKIELLNNTISVKVTENQFFLIY